MSISTLHKGDNNNNNNNNNSGSSKDLSSHFSNLLNELLCYLRAYKLCAELSVCAINASMKTERTVAVPRNMYLRLRTLFTLSDSRSRSVTHSVCNFVFRLRITARNVPVLRHASKESHFFEEPDLICLVIRIIMAGEDI